MHQLGLNIELIPYQGQAESSLQGQLFVEDVPLAEKSCIRAIRFCKMQLMYSSNYVVPQIMRCRGGVLVLQMAPVQSRLLMMPGHCIQWTY